jgi:hypothetical protein
LVGELALIQQIPVGNDSKKSKGNCKDIASAKTEGPLLIGAAFGFVGV